MKFINRDKAIELINKYASDNEDFIFVIDYAAEKVLVCKIKELKEYGISCAFNGVEYGVVRKSCNTIGKIDINPVSLESYKHSFDIVQKGLNNGDTYLLNLTSRTEILQNLDLQLVYALAKAKYKFLLPDKFIFYSPETFVNINGNMIYSYPMKGTISAKEHKACATLLEDKKELCEHYTIVDLIRNDLAMVADKIQVEKFRYVEKLETDNGSIFQTSSIVSGVLEDGWQSRLGNIIFKLLPAGSISGAPKKKTLEIIGEAELQERDFYTGITGAFINGRLDSCVNIRYIEKDGDKFYYRSGGGITAKSCAKSEYEELITKIYIPC